MQCMLYPTATMTFSSLISQARSFDAIKDCEGPTALTLIYNPNATPKYGGFKRVLFGHLSCPVISSSTSICIKQCWYSCKASGGQLIYDNHMQIGHGTGTGNTVCFPPRVYTGTGTGLSLPNPSNTVPVSMVSRV